MRFGSPSLLFILVAVPAVVIAYVMLERSRRGRARLWSQPAMLPNVERDPFHRWRLVPAVLLLVGLSLLVVGVARPELVRSAADPEAPTIVLAFDLSSSMGANDVKPTRIAAARSLAVTFLRRLPPSYRVAVVTFGNTPSVAVPPTLDRNEVIAGLPQKSLSLSGTAIGDAVNEAVALAAGNVATAQASGGSVPGAVLLFSDGGQNAGGVTPRQAATSALVDYVPVDTVAIGTAKGEATQISRAAGFPVTVEIPVPLDTGTLSTLAQQTDGRFFRATAVEQSPRLLDAVYRPLQATTTPGHKIDDLSAFGAAASIVLIAVSVALSGFLFGKAL